jgi:hypothetical protein
MRIELQGCNEYIAYIIYDALQCMAAMALPQLFLVAPLIRLSGQWTKDAKIKMKMKKWRL